jgi:arylsulfatase B
MPTWKLNLYSSYINFVLLFVLQITSTSLHAFASSLPTSPNFSPSLPHIVIIIIDDWGWNNFGLHSKTQENKDEIQTPNLDSLANNGIILDRFYAFRFCSPSRSALLSGRNPIHVNILNSPLSVYNASDPISGAAGIPQNMTTISERLRDAKYFTAHTGKWHAGLFSKKVTPFGRGFNRTLGYLAGYNDYYTQQTGDWCNDNLYTDLYTVNNEPAYGLNNSQSCSQTNQSNKCIYEDDLFTDYALSAIDESVILNKPLFLYYAPHACHQPLQVPNEYVTKFSFICVNDTSVQCQYRLMYAALVNSIDDHIGRVISKLKENAMYDNTIILTLADNSGPIYGEPGFTCTLCDGAAGGNNYPLRGGKHSNFEGGVRVNAFMSGGLIPIERRGATVTGLISIEDMFTSLLSLANIDPFDHQGAAANLPKVDGLNLIDYIFGRNNTNPRTEIILGSGIGGAADGDTMVQALIRQDGYKCIIASLNNAIWQGPFYPNSSTLWNNSNIDCGNSGCLFNVFTDPSEYIDIAKQEPEILAEMLQRIQEIQKTVFSPQRGLPSPLACQVSRDKCRGFICPFIDD